MAGDWLKFEKDTLDKPEVFAIAEALGIDPDAVIGKLMRVWSWFDSHTVDGNAARVTSSLLDRVAGVPGFIAAMALEGWATIETSGVALPHFDRHNGETAKQRALTAKRVQKHKAKGNDAGNDAGVSGALPREEKRREDVEKQKATGQQAGHDAAPPDELPQDIAKPDAPVPPQDEGEAPPPKRITSTGKKQTAEHFPKFWAAYPVKKGKADALKKWKSKGCDAMADQIIAHVRRMEREDDDWLRGFIPHGSTYINGERWEDEPKKDKAQTAPAPAPDTFGAKAVAERNNTETPLERAMAYIRHQASLGAYGEGEEGQAGMRAAMQAAREKHGGGNGNS
ncbi:hypothetical protein [Xanthomonas citri phage CP2]|uniref:replication initiation protein n=1 Tax=Xanthomonas citri phage CP2 TaxID=1188795 RepID=UPI00029B5B93|nr:replication initiation protein [Xanthomonas citri phage CP2]BAM66463.1 hypothetical protein [Xanthomonas citri phage CP2]